MTSGYVLQFTSPLPGDGKTTMSSNLAISLCQSGKRVLIIDADLRRDSIAKTLGIDPHFGLADVLEMTTTAEEAVTDHPTIEGLHVLAGGSRPLSPSELLSLPAFGELLTRLRQQFDFIVVDTPPVLSVIDPVVVADQTDGVVVVLKLDKESRTHCKKTVNLLQQAKVNILGLALNRSTNELSASDREEVGYGFGSAAARSRAYYSS